MYNYSITPRGETKMIQMTEKEYAMKRLDADLRNDDYSIGEGSDEYLLTGRGWNI